MFIAILQKSATSELWWIGSAFVLFLTALIFVSGYKHFKNRGARKLQDQAQEEKEDSNSETNAHNGETTAS